MESKEKKLQVHDLRISFRTNNGKVQAVRGISFDLHKGETLAIVGESGSGKSVTSKAILGIQAANAIHDGGEILYDGMDLMSISEDDFYRIRGDRIAMIFQDPLSSLNPIMRIGKQLTEAMLLKGKARKTAAKKRFQDMLGLLEKSMADSTGDAAAAHAQIASFRTLELESVKAEGAYNDALDAAREALAETENILFLISKNAWKDPSDAAKVRDFAMRSVHPFVVPEAEKEGLRRSAETLVRGLKAAMRQGNLTEKEQALRSIKDVLEKAVGRERPDFLAMTWYRRQGKPEVRGSQEECNRVWSECLHTEFLDQFEAAAEKGLTYADKNYEEKRGEAADALRRALSELEGGGMEALVPLIPELCRTVDASIHPMDLVKDSQACTFSGSMKAFAARYDEGIRTNDRKEKRYEREVARSEKKKARGREWTVAAPSVIDLDLVRENMRGLMQGLLSHYEERSALERTEDKAQKTRRLIESLESDASGMASTITKWAAKNRALKLMEEVGISDARRRYRQYPFEFSGGMRQRIVIAIALAADPDILICDEPTTALDVTIQAQILELINRLKEERKLSIIFITHDLGVVANMADRIAVMYAGKIVEYGTAEEIFYSPAHPYTWALLSSMPDLDTRDKLEAIPGTPPNMIYPPKGDAFAERNRYAMEIDFEREPPVFTITPTHWAATWLLHPNAPKVEMPRSIQERIARMKARMEADNHG